MKKKTVNVQVSSAGVDSRAVFSLCGLRYGCALSAKFHHHETGPRTGVRLCIVCRIVVGATFVPRGAPCQRAAAIRHPYTPVDIYQWVSVNGAKVVKYLIRSGVYGGLELVGVREIPIVPVKLVRYPIPVRAPTIAKGRVRIEPTGREFASLADFLEVNGVTASVLDFGPALSGNRGAEECCGECEESDV